MNNVCHIIGNWYNIVLKEYNKGLPENKQFRNLVICITKYLKMQKLRNDLLIYLKLQDEVERIDKIHKKKLNRGTTEPEVYRQLLDTFNLL